jgi:hypothetical protein
VSGGRKILLIGEYSQDAWLCVIKRDSLSFSVIHKILSIKPNNYVDREIRWEHYGVALSEVIYEPQYSVCACV